MKTRVTRKSYRRNVIMFGVMLFLSIALISTGFAAWVMSSDAVKTPSGDITVSTITESSLTLDVELVSNGTVVFGPLEGDTQGNVKCDPMAETEQLDIVIKGRVNRTDILESITIRLYADETVSRNLIAARDAGYIKLPACLDIKAYDSATSCVVIEVDLSELDEVQVSVEGEGGEPTQVTAYEFTETISFGWGDKYKHNDTVYNPSIYYDLEEESIQAIPYETVMADLLAMRATILGYESTNDPVQDAALGQNLSFTVEVVAKAN